MILSGTAGRLAAIGLCLLGTAMLGGCAGTHGFDASQPDNAGTALVNMVAFNKLHVPAAPAATTDEKVDCPTVEVLDGTASLRTYTGADQSNNNVRYQYSMGDVVRECTHVGGDLVLKVGVEGRVLIGPAGTPGSFTAPVRIAIRSEKTQQVVASKFYRIPVTVAPSDTQADFSLVSDPINVPFTTAHSAEDYTIVVGFDAKGESAPAPKMARRRHH